MNSNLFILLPFLLSYMLHDTISYRSHKSNSKYNYKSPRYSIHNKHPLFRKSFFNLDTSKTLRTFDVPVIHTSFQSFVISNIITKRVLNRIILDFWAALTAKCTLDWVILNQSNHRFLPPVLPSLFFSTSLFCSSNLMII